MNGEEKGCPVCSRRWPVTTLSCVCGHVFRTQYVPTHNPPPGATTFFQAPQGYPPFNSNHIPQPSDALLRDLARRHKECNKLFIWTLVVGTLCLWPIWIVSYLEYNKMRDIKTQIAQMNIDIPWWMSTYSAV